MKEIRTIHECLQRFELNLEDLVVLTEAGSGSFAWTPILALLAGAKRVYAIVKSSPYGDPVALGQDCEALARRAGVAARLVIVQDTASIGDVDVVTNLGFVRPLNAELITALKQTAVIPLMWETWEFRPADLDLAACLCQGILVLGTNESHPDLRFMDYVGMTVLRLLLEAEVPAARSRILLVGGGAFAEAVAMLLQRIGATVRVICERTLLPSSCLDMWVGSSLGGPGVETIISEAEALVFLDHYTETSILGPEASMDAAGLARINSDLTLVHLSGMVDAEGLRQHGFALHPKRISVLPRTMSVTPGWLGAKPVIELHAAGLKVGEVMARARREWPGDLDRARALALSHSLCQDFSPEQYRIYGQGSSLEIQ